MSLTNGLLSYWKLDENTGTTAFDSVGSNDGAIVGATWTTGKINGGLDFDGSDDYIQTSLDKNDLPITISLWVNLDSTASPNFIIGNDNGGWDYSIITGFNGNVWSAGIGTSRMDSVTTPTTGVWNYLVLTIDNIGSANLYLNGISIATSSSGANTGGASNFTIGRKPTTTFYYTNGKIDEIGIWNRALTSTEVSELYNSGAGLSYPFTSQSSAGFLMRNF